MTVSVGVVAGPLHMQGAHAKSMLSAMQRTYGRTNEESTYRDK